MRQVVVDRRTATLIRRIIGAGLASCVLLFAACGPRDTPESQVRSVISEGETAAEARDLSGLMHLVSPAYRDDRGNGPDELKQYLRGYLVVHQSVHLLVKVGSITFPYRDMARVSLTLASLGTGGAAAGGLDVAGNVYDVHLELQFEDGHWRVTHAAWDPAQGG
jgi:hypothetical protein